MYCITPGNLNVVDFYTVAELCTVALLCTEAHMSGADLSVAKLCTVAEKSVA